jgi:hypothetical protein
MPVPVRRLLVLAGSVSVAVAVLASPARSSVSVASVVSSAAPAGQVHGCDPIGTGNCLIPFPDDYYAVASRSSRTGERIAFSAAMMPASAAGVHIDASSWDRLDGFSPGDPIITVMPGVSLTTSHVAPITDIGSSLDPNAPIVILNARTGQPMPYWAEMDAANPNPASDALLIHPAYRLSDQTTYVVAIRNLVNAAGMALTPGSGFAAVLGANPPSSGVLRQRWFELHPVLAFLAAHGVPANGLDQAWEFTTASTKSLTGQVLHMRDQAFAALGNHAPVSVVTKVSSPAAARRAGIARIVDGYVEVPSYLNQPGGPPGSVVNFGTSSPRLYAAPVHTPGNTQQAAFECVIPRAALSAPAHNVMLFGHGLLQDQTIVSSAPVEKQAASHAVVICAADWLGMSAQDLDTLIKLTQNLSAFGSVPDRMQQAYLDFMFLGRAMIRPDGLSSLAAFRARGHSVIGSRPSLAYAGYSLGGIQGAALSSIAQDYTRAALFVPGSEFSMMIERSADFTSFAQLIGQTYPDKLGYQVGIALIQMLWDRGEPDGYVDHLTGNPLPGTPAKHVLVQMVFGDHQVPNIAAETLARTLGLSAYTPELAGGRDPDVTPFWGIPAIGTFPFSSNSLFMWDSGAAPPPLANTPPPSGHDPHDDLSVTAASEELATDFLLTGHVTNVCAGSPCVAQQHP